MKAKLKKDKRKKKILTVPETTSPSFIERASFVHRDKISKLPSKAFIFAFFTTIGIIAPGYWLAGLLYALGLCPFEPHFYQAVFVSLCCLPLGGLLTLLGFKYDGKWFAPLMMYLFVYGLFLPVVIGFIFAFIISGIIAPLLGVNLSLLSIGVYVVLTIASICYGIFSTIETVESAEISEAQSSFFNRLSPNRINIAPVAEAVFSSDSDSDSDSGSSDGGGDGGGD